MLPAAHALHDDRTAHVMRTAAKTTDQRALAFTYNLPSAELAQSVRISDLPARSALALCRITRTYPSQVCSHSQNLSAIYQQ